MAQVKTFISDAVVWPLPQDKRNSDIKEESTSRDRKQKEGVKEESKAREKDRDRTKESDRDRHKEPERDKQRDAEGERARNRAKQDRDRGPRERGRDAERERARRGEAGKEKERWRERDKGRDRRRGKDGDPSGDADREKGREHDRPERKVGPCRRPLPLICGSCRRRRAWSGTAFLRRRLRQPGLPRGCARCFTRRWPHPCAAGVRVGARDRGFARPCASSPACAGSCARLARGHGCLHTVRAARQGRARSRRSSAPAAALIVVELNFQVRLRRARKFVWFQTVFSKRADTFGLTGGGVGLRQASSPRGAHVVKCPHGCGSLLLWSEPRSQEVQGLPRARGWVVRGGARAPRACGISGAQCAWPLGTQRLPGSPWSDGRCDRCHENQTSLREGFRNNIAILHLLTLFRGLRRKNVFH